MIEKHFNKLSLNPFLISLIFQSFYKGYNKEFCKLPIHYIITPLIMYKESRDLFATITKNALLEKIIDENKTQLIELQERVWKMRELTHLSLIEMANSNKIELKANVKINEVIDYEKHNTDLKEYLRSAYYLGVLFKDFSIPDIYKFFKVIP